MSALLWTSLSSRRAELSSPLPEAAVNNNKKHNLVTLPHVEYLKSTSIPQTYYHLHFYNSQARNVSDVRNLSLTDCYYSFIFKCSVLRAVFYIRKEGNVLFNDALNTFYLRLYGVSILHTVKKKKKKKILNII